MVKGFQPSGWKPCLIGCPVERLAEHEIMQGRVELQWDADGFAPGVYYVKVMVGEAQAVKKVILNKH